MAEGGDAQATPEIRLVIIGKTGNGKSRTGNTILGKKYFPFGSRATGCTIKCNWGSAVRFGAKVDVVDTPGVFDSRDDNVTIQNEISRCIAMTTPGPHAILLCIKMGRFGPEDIQTVEHFKVYFGENLFQYVIVVFTRRDEWEADNADNGIIETEEEYIKNLPRELSSFISECGNRYTFLNNKLKIPDQQDEQDEQVKRLIGIVKDLNVCNDRKSYTNEMYQIVEQLLVEEMKKNANVDRDEIKKDPAFIAKVISALAATLTTLVVVAAATIRR